MVLRSCKCVGEVEAVTLSSIRQRVAIVMEEDGCQNFKIAQTVKWW